MEDMKERLKKMNSVLGRESRVLEILMAGRDAAETERMDQVSRDWEKGIIDVLFCTTAGIQSLDCSVSLFSTPLNPVFSR